MTKTNQEKQHQDHFEFESILLLFFIYYISILIMTVISRDCHFLAITPKTLINPVHVADFL